VENIRKKCVLAGFQAALEHQKPSTPPATLLDGEQEAKLIAMRLGLPPKGYSNWTLRLLARQLVVLEIVESISHETIRRRLKKTA
jgi:Homeodomain-like domain